jgi:hypothetical protein
VIFQRATDEFPAEIGGNTMARTSPGFTQIPKLEMSMRTEAAAIVLGILVSARTCDVGIPPDVLRICNLTLL